MDINAQATFARMRPDERLALAKMTADVLVCEAEVPININSMSKQLGRHYLLNNRLIGDLTSYLAGVDADEIRAAMKVDEDAKKRLTTACNVMYLIGAAPEYDRLEKKLLIDAVAEHYHVDSTINEASMLKALERGKNDKYSSVRT